MKERVEMDLFSEKIKAFMEEFGKGRKMVLSTAEDGIVSSRMMSVVRIGGEFYFQTDITMKKYRQLSANENAALCIDNIQIEGRCAEIGRPLDNEDFCRVFRECFRGSFDAYSALENERVFAVKPVYIERWVYKDGDPYIEEFDLCGRRYSFERYGSAGTS